MKKNLIALLVLTLCLLLFACGEKKADEPDAPDVPDTPTVDPAPPEKTPEHWHIPASESNHRRNRISAVPESQIQRSIQPFLPIDKQTAFESHKVS